MPLESEQREKKKSKLLMIIVITVLVLLLTVVGVLVFLLLNKEEVQSVDSGSNVSQSVGALLYESNIVLDDPKTLQDSIDEMRAKAEEGQMALEMKNQAFSKDGQYFSCYFANSKANSYDMFMVFYLDETQEEIYRTGLIPIGARIEEFTLEQPLEKGIHEITVVFCQVEDDLETLHAKVNVGIQMIVQ